jgi:LCP family protein required for cell wall assembly
VPSGGPASANESGLRELGDRIDRANKRTRRGGPGPAGSGSGGPGAPRRPRGYRRSGKPRWSRRRKILTILSSIVLFAVVAAGALYGYARYRYDQIKKIHVGSEVAQISGQPFNMLVVGSDSRVGLSGSAAAQAGSVAEVPGQRSDVIMVWHVDPATRAISILSIPRDTLVSNVGGNVAEFGTFNRINATFDSGVDSLVQTITADFGIPINHVMQVDFSGFEGMVDAIGGIYLNFPYPAKDAYSGLNVTTTGCQLLNGTQALAVARSRDYEYESNGYWQYDGTGDFGRIQRQDAFLRALVDQAKTKYNPLTINALLGSIPQGITIDDQLTLSDLIGLAQDFHGIGGSALATQTLPTISNGYVSPWGDVLFVDQPAAQQLLVSMFGSQLLAPTAPPPNTDLRPTPPPTVTTTTLPVPVAPSTGHASTTTAPPVTTTTTPAPPSFDPVPCSPT